ncbi:hypothetical protein TKK_0002777 [Trichogramma kaykai]
MFVRVIFLMIVLRAVSSISAPWKKSRNNDDADDDLKIFKYCRERDETSPVKEGSSDYKLAEAEVNSTLILYCSYCNEAVKKFHAPKIWYYASDNNRSYELEEVPISMDNDVGMARVLVTTNLSLILRQVWPQDARLYRCLRPLRHDVPKNENETVVLATTPASQDLSPELQDYEQVIDLNNESEMDDRFNYRVEIVEKEDKKNVTDQRGNYKDYEKFYREVYVPVTQKIAESEDADLRKVSEAGWIIELATEFGSWGPCRECKNKKGNRTRKAHCRVKSTFNETMITRNDVDPDIIEMFQRSPLLSCRSTELRERLPIIGNLTRDLPQFEQVEVCKPCKKEKKSKKYKFKHRRRYLLNEATQLSIVCPEASEESNVVWRKESKILKKGKGHSVRKKDPTERILVDPFFTLYLRDVGKPEQGNYTCTVDGTRMLQVKLTVVMRPRVTIKELLKYLGYLSFIFLVSFVAWIIGIIRACRNPQIFAAKQQEELEELMKDL